MTMAVLTASMRDNFFWQLLNRPAGAAALVLLLVIMATSLAAPWLAALFTH